MGVMRNACKNLVGKPEGNIALARPRRRREDNIRMDLKEAGWEDADWMHVTQDSDRWWTLVNTVMSLRVS
jgi:hypothetical protein